MATTESAVSQVTETCEDCDRETLHQVDVQILEESRENENTEFSREPYRVSECLHCGSTTKIRMNNA